MSLLADVLSTVFERRHGPRRGVRGDPRPIQELTADLVGAKGEISGLALAGSILDSYAVLDDSGRLAFFRHLAQAMAIHPHRVRDALERYEAGQSKKSYRDFMAASEPPRQELIRRLNQVPGATNALVGMRADLLRLGSDEEPLMALDLDFRHLFASWFNRGFLVLRPISWESPAHILEKIIAYEAVHAIDTWEELRRRVGPADRRCFAFFHPAMPDEPLIFVEVALTRGIPASVQAVLAEDRDPIGEEHADTAVFYSISNCQAGLSGVSFGNSLIKQVAAELSMRLPGLKTFITLSPVPGLMSWMDDQGLQYDPHDEGQIRALAARFLLHAKGKDGLPLDPVARFHLSNGASLHQIKAGADMSPKGRAQSAGVMASYLYDLSKISENHELFASTQGIASSSGVRALGMAAEKKPG